MENNNNKNLNIPEPNSDIKKINLAIKGAIH